MITQLSLRNFRRIAPMELSATSSIGFFMEYRQCKPSEIETMMFSDAAITNLQEVERSLIVAQQHPPKFLISTGRGI